MPKPRRTRPAPLRVVAARRTSYRQPQASLKPRAGPPGVPASPAILTRIRRPRSPAAEPRHALTGSLTADSLTLTLPLPPSVNHQYATVNGRRVLSARGRSFKQVVAQQVLISLAGTAERERWLGRFRTDFLGLTVRFYFPSLLRRDVDGGLKITQDALCQALGINDNRILHIHLIKALDPAGPRMEVALFCTETARATPPAARALPSK